MNTICALARVVLKELYRRKDFYVLFILTALVTLLMVLANLFDDNKIVSSVKEVCLLLIWISALAMAVGTTTRQIPAECENRTIFPLLAKPVTRAQVIMGKFLGCWLACGIALAFFYLFLGVVSGSYEHELRALDYLQAFWMHWMFLGMVIAMLLFGSVIFAAPSSNATICLVVIVAVFLVGGHINQIAIGRPEPYRTGISLVYYVLPHFDWFDLRNLIMNHSGLIGIGDCSLASLYAAAYAAFFLFAAWLAFRRKALNA
jgi:ABC-type transport system involved in multi-copper enzyme maturation permease subunit